MVEASLPNGQRTRVNLNGSGPGSGGSGRGTARQNGRPAPQFAQYRADASLRCLHTLQRRAPLGLLAEEPAHNARSGAILRAPNSSYEWSSGAWRAPKDSSHEMTFS